MFTFSAGGRGSGYPVSAGQFLQANRPGAAHPVCSELESGWFNLVVGKCRVFERYSRLFKQSELYKGESISNQPIPFSMNRDGHDFQALFQYMFYTREQNYTLIESFFDKILNVKHG